MEDETVTRHNYEQFLDGFTAAGGAELDLMERDGQTVPEQVKQDHRRLMTMGIVSMIAGGGLLAISNAGIFTKAWPFCLAAAGIGVGLGALRIARRAMRKNTLTLPSLELRRKTERVPQNAMNTFGIARRRGFGKSLTDKVIMGICGGLAESSGIPAALIRAVFIFLFAVTGGLISIVYVLLGLILPTRPRQ